MEPHDILNFYKELEAENTILEGVRMKILKIIHGYEILIKDNKDLLQLTRIFRERLPLYFTSREEKSS